MSAATKGLPSNYTKRERRKEDREKRKRIERRERG